MAWNELELVVTMILEKQMCFVSVRRGRKVWVLGGSQNSQILVNERKKEQLFVSRQCRVG